MLKRWFWITASAMFPRWRQRHYDSSLHRAGCTNRTSLPGCDCPMFYRCWSCNQQSSDRPGYSGFVTATYAELCERCWKRRRRWSWLYWCETGETITVPFIDGDGVVSPSTSRSSYTYHVYSLFGFRFVRADAAKNGLASAKNAGYWFGKLRVSGNSNMVEKINRWQDIDEGGEIIREALKD